MYLTVFYFIGMCYRSFRLIRYCHSTSRDVLPQWHVVLWNKMHSRVTYSILLIHVWYLHLSHQFMYVISIMWRPVNLTKIKRMTSRLNEISADGKEQAVLSMNYLEVNKCAFTFSSEIRQIQCMRTEFWCVQFPRPAGPSALDKHQIQASALDLSYFTSKSKCKYFNLIHTRQKKIICPCSWKIINKMALECH